jgi:hypothetical protein
MSSLFWAWILTILDRLGRGEDLTRLWILLQRPDSFLSPTVRWPGSSSALSSLRKKTRLLFFLNEAVWWRGSFQCWTGLVLGFDAGCYLGCFMDCWGPPGNLPLFLYLLFSFLFLFPGLSLLFEFQTDFYLIFQVLNCLNISIIWQ